MTEAEAFVFVSVARKDVVRTGVLLEALEKHGIAARRLQDLVAPGQNWTTRHASVMRSARAVLVVWSQASRQSSNVLAEAHTAVRDGTYVAVTVDGIEAVPPDFAQLPTVDISTWQGDVSAPEIVRLV